MSAATRRYAIRHPESRCRAGMSLAERLHRKAEVTPGGCWIYRGAPQRGGYAQLRWEGRLHYVHRLSYETFVAPIPEGMQIDHLCRVRNCFNPDHLEPVTQAENNRRGRVARAAERAA